MDRKTHGQIMPDRKPVHPQILFSQMRRIDLFNGRRSQHQYHQGEKPAFRKQTSLLFQERVNQAGNRDDQNRKAYLGPDQAEQRKCTNKPMLFKAG